MQTMKAWFTSSGQETDWLLAGLPGPTQGIWTHVYSNWENTFHDSSVKLYLKDTFQHSNLL